MNSNQPPSPNGESPQSTGSAALLRRTLWWTIGIAAVSAVVAYTVVQATTRRPPEDPTSERIQSLIDEANRLLRTLDDKKRS